MTKTITPFVMSVENATMTDAMIKSQNVVMTNRKKQSFVQNATVAMILNAPPASMTNAGAHRN